VTEDEYQTTVDRLRARACAAVEPEDFTEIALDVEDMLAALAAWALTRPDAADFHDADVMMNGLWLIRRALRRAAYLERFRRSLGEGRP